MPRPVSLVLFDWGGTLMVDYGLPGPMVGWPEVAAVDGAGAALAALGPDHRLALATNAADSDEADIWRALGRVGLAGYLDAVYCARGLGLRKPDPAFFAAAVRDQGLRPERAAMVGDGYADDIRGALAAGLKAVWLAPGRGCTLDRNLAVVGHLRELPEALARLGL